LLLDRFYFKIDQRNALEIGVNMKGLLKEKPSHNRETKIILIFYFFAYLLNYVASYLLLQSNWGIHSSVIYILLVYAVALLISC